jgi:tripartite-type tricarboxylate transporter receptor subunit TctC
VYFSPLSVALGHVRANRLRALAVTSKERMPFLPEVPTLAESGYPDYEFNLWNGFLVPANTPKDIIAVIHRAVIGALNTPEVRKRFLELGTSPVGNQPGEFGAFLKSEVESIAEVVKKLKLGDK